MFNIVENELILSLEYEVTKTISIKGDILLLKKNK